MNILSAYFQSLTIAVVRFDDEPSGISASDVTFIPALEVFDVEVRNRELLLHTARIVFCESYKLQIKDHGSVIVSPWDLFETLASDKPLGCVMEGDVAVFRLFAPRAFKVVLEMYDSAHGPEVKQVAMEPQSDGVWETRLPNDGLPSWYCYRIDGPREEGEEFDPSIPVADPYAKSVVVRNIYQQPARTRIIFPGSETPVKTDWITVDPRDLLVYELHVRDMTAHPSSLVPEHRRGTYLGLVYPGVRGGIEHIKSLGVNAVELMPVMTFPKIEIPYRQQVLGWYNTWNPYCRNHWGYMTSYFFAPEPYYASGHLEPGAWLTMEGEEITQFKQMVKAFHDHGIAVILDVVFNHTSMYDFQPLRLADRKYYYNLDDNGRDTGWSGCGNDFKTDRPMARRLILDSLKYWMTEFKLDGFRFDLASLIDQETVEIISEELRSLNPGVVLIAEAWTGKEEDVARFVSAGIACWNDGFRNEVKGTHPVREHGMIFGKHFSPELFTRLVMGSTTDHGGVFKGYEHAVNFVESHDGYTLGDFIRIASGEIHVLGVVEDREKHAVLSFNQQVLNELAAMILFTSRGIIMMAEGQEFARSKVIADTNVPDVRPGMLDSNSYEKDDETNWINFDHADKNATLVSFYRELINIRKRYPSFRRAGDEDYEFIFNGQTPACGFYIREKAAPEFAVLFNFQQENEATFVLNGESWEVLLAGSRVKREHLDIPRIVLPPSSGIILRKRS
ncbi:MAG: pullulanase [Chlorobi bacterium]|nr:pullulanase [Chlorobiota bacterium]